MWYIDRPTYIAYQVYLRGIWTAYLRGIWTLGAGWTGVTGNVCLG